MRYRPFGRTGLEVSELVFGGGWVGGVLIHQDDDTKLKVLRHAIDAGINWIDTASSYGNGQSEQALGWLLPELKTKPYVSTWPTISSSLAVSSTTLVDTYGFVLSSGNSQPSACSD